MKKWLILLACLLPLRVEAKLLELSYFELDNGLKVAVIENHKAPVVLHQLYYNTGSINDPNGKGGIAHLLEHLMFRGTKQVPDGVFNRLTDEYGAENNAYTTYDETGYYEFSDISKLELMMALEADRMSNLNLTEQAFLKERGIVLEERMQRFETNPVPLFYETMSKILWQEHPLSKPVSGSVTEIKGLQLQDAQNFYQTWYRPDNALLVLSGDITPKEAKEVVKKYYGSIPRGTAKLPQAEINNPKAADTTVVMRRPAIEKSRYVSYVRIEPNTLSHKDEAALGVLLEYLAGDDTSYLYEHLVYGKKKLLSADMGLSYTDKLGGMLAFYTTPADEKMNIDELETLVEDTIKEGFAALKAEKITQIKNQQLATTVYLEENPNSAARFVGGMLMEGYQPDEIENFDELILSITKDDVLAAWKKVMQATVRVQGMLIKENAGE